MIYFWPLVLQVLAFLIAMAEVMVPSFGILSFICVSLTAYSWYFIFTRLPHSALIIFGILDLFLIPIGIKLAFHLLRNSPLSHGTDLGTGSGLEKIDAELQRHVGVVAVVDAPLRPTGKIRIEDEIYEAQTTGEFVDRGVPVKVVSVIGSRFQVEKV